MHLPAYAMAVNYSEDKRITIIIITEAVCSSGVVGTDKKKEKVRAAIRQSLQNWGNWPGPSYPERTPRPKKNNANDHGNQSVAKDDTDNIAIEKLVALPLSAEEIENEAGLYSNNDLVQL